MSDTTKTTVLAYLLDPEARTLKKVEFTPGDGDQIRELLGCDLFDVVRLSDGNAIFVDDEGLLKDPDFFTIVLTDDMEEPLHLAGRTLFVGPVNDEGLETACTLTPDWFSDHTRGGATQRGFDKMLAAGRAA